MYNAEHLQILKQGAAAWNQWREQNPEIHPYLRGANLTKAKLTRVNLSDANLHEANLSAANLHGGNLTLANLRKADLHKADLGGANLTGADLRWANLHEANLHKANLREANLSAANLYGVNLTAANLQQASLVMTNLEQANLTGCLIYGMSASGLLLNDTKQSNLIITQHAEPTIIVDNLEIAQFISLLLHNEKIRDVIDSITSKVVLILGRFKPELKVVLDAIREELRRRDYLPILFDLKKLGTRDFTQTASTLAHMARFVIADVTDSKNVLEEVLHIVRNVAVPVKPLLLKGSGKEPVTLDNLRRNHQSLLDTHWYDDPDDLLASLGKKIIAPAEAKAKELEKGP